MAKACGIHVDRSRYHLVAIEGGARKHRVVAHTSGQIEPGENAVDAVARGLKQACKAQRISSENVGLAVDSGQAAFRSLQLPFDDRGKIEEVIKFEVENELPQWNVDDVVVDFLIVDSKPGVHSDLLVTAVPKERLAVQIEACARAGLDPQDAELDGTALFNAADAAGALDPESAQLLVHVGDATTVVVLVDGGNLRSIRAIRAGSRPARGPAEEPGEPPEVPGEPPEVPGEPGAPEEGEQEAAVDDAERLRQLEQSARRIRRELSRTIVGAHTRNDVSAVYLSGDDLPGLSGEILDRPIERLDAVPADLPERSSYTVAYGAALSQLGVGRVRAHLRREELRLSGKFERLELPLAVLALLACTLLGVKWITLNHQLHWRDQWEPGTDSPSGDMQIWLQASNVYMLPDAEQGTRGRLENPPERIVEYARRAERDEDTTRTKYGQLREIRRMLTIEIDGLQKELGQVSEIPQPQSALKGSTLVMDALRNLGPQVGRFAIRALQADYSPGRGGSDDFVLVKLDADFFAGSALEATGNFSNFINALRAEPWTRKVEEKATTEFENGGGIYINGLTIEVDVLQADPGGVDLGDAGEVEVGGGGPGQGDPDRGGPDRGDPGQDDPDRSAAGRDEEEPA